MNKTMAFVLLVLEVMLLFSACSAAVPEDKTEEDEEPESISCAEENFLPEGAFSIGFLGEYELFAAEESREMKNHRFFNEDGKQYLDETEVVYYSILDSSGNKAVPHPAEHYSFLHPGDRGYEDKELFYISYKGDMFCYFEEDGELVTESQTKAGPTGEKLNGFEKTVYFCGTEYPDLTGFGLNYPDGSVFIEPIYQKVEAPFDDRFILMYGFVPQAAETMACDIIDLEGNLICDEYNHVVFYHLDDGSYVGIGECVGDVFLGEVICRDENGNIYEKGTWFIDKDGNKISEKFEYATVEHSGYGENFKVGKTITVTYEDGTEEIFPIETYAVKP